MSADVPSHSGCLYTGTKAGKHHVTHEVVQDPSTDPMMIQVHFGTVTVNLCYRPNTRQSTPSLVTGNRQLWQTRRVYVAHTNCIMIDLRSVLLGLAFLVYSLSPRPDMADTETHTLLLEVLPNHNSCILYKWQIQVIIIQHTRRKWG